jgi:hypothetical protein
LINQGPIMPNCVCLNLSLNSVLSSSIYNKPGNISRKIETGVTLFQFWLKQIAGSAGIVDVFQIGN